MDQVTSIGNTGDLLLFANEKFWPRLRKLLRCSEWCHVGILWLEPQTREPFVWESAPGSKPGQYDYNHDVLTGQSGKSGAQLVRLREKLSQYPGYCNLVRLAHQQPLDFHKQVFPVFSSTPFSNPPLWPIALSCFDIPAQGVSHLRSASRFSCVELAVATYTALGVWDNKQYCAVPKQFIRSNQRVGNMSIVDEHRIVFS